MAINQKNKASVLVIGAGPVGLLTALRLARASIPTIILESHTSLLPLTRAMVYLPTVVSVLRKFGVLDAIIANGYVNHEGAVWIDHDGNHLAQLKFEAKSNDGLGAILAIGQYRMSGLILKELEKFDCVQIRFGMKFVGIEEVDHKVRVMAHDTSTDMGGEDIMFEADYAMGTDGANSSVRRALCLPFEGFTYHDWKMIGTDVLYDFPKHEGYSPLNFMVHPIEWAFIAYTGEDAEGIPCGSGTPQWRIAYPEDPSLPSDKASVMARAYDRVKQFIKTNSGDDPEQGKYTVTRAEPYIMHQRVASKARKGRVFLAGDALHSNNPVGALGLTGGICDAFCYGNALIRVLKHNEPDDLLTRCANNRRDTWINVTNTLSRTNIRRLHSFEEPDIKAREEFFKRLNEDATFPALVRKGMDALLTETFEMEVLNGTNLDDDEDKQVKTDGVAKDMISDKKPDLLASNSVQLEEPVGQ